MEMSYDLYEMPTGYSLFKKKSILLCVIKQIPNAAASALFQPFKLLNLALCYTFFSMEYVFNTRI